MPGRVEEGSGPSKSANERFEGIGRGDLNSVVETPGISQQLRRVTVYLLKRVARGLATRTVLMIDVRQTARISETGVSHLRCGDWLADLICSRTAIRYLLCMGRFLVGCWMLKNHNRLGIWSVAKR